ncbi:MAG TPA: zinc-dependent metalloprotease [Puia sp.]|nr:zinc-dependent metalloprotease [Puia sp.]
MKTTFLLAGLLLTGLAIHAQKKKTIIADTAKSKPVLPPSKIKSYKEIVTDKAVTGRGLFTVHKVEDKWYFEIPDSLFNREFLAVTRYSRTPGGAGLYGGEAANEQTMYWEKGPDNKIFLRIAVMVSAADSTQAIYKAVKSSTVDPIAAAFDIQAFSKDSMGVVIDVTGFFKEDNQVVSLRPGIKRELNLNGLLSDRSYIQNIGTYPMNTEVRTVKTYGSNPPEGGFAGPRTVVLPSAVVAGVATLEMNTSFILLPKTPMRKRLYDQRVGYFVDAYSIFSDSSQKAAISNFIVRWRLEPRPEDVEKMKRGELVEPQKPIVYYIDPATPKKWRPYLILGINDWQKAFEQAGFKNAIIGKEWPEGDSTMSLEDARFNVIRYFASDIPNAYGPNVHDPRSGEIIESHIGWYHNVMSLVHNWYLIQAGAIDARARTMKFDDELMGQLIRFVSSHEIGHTLGLRHNLGASSTTPVELLRNKAWVEANGHTASIMDYARFNYVAQPEDNIGPAGIYPRIGVYDKWAIQWGYKPLFGTKDEDADKLILNRITIDSLAANKRLWFGSEEVRFDPRIQTEDLGDNAMKASEYGIRNLKRILQHLPEWTREEADPYDNLKEMYGEVINQYVRYIGHVAGNIGGYYHDFKSIEQSGKVFTPMTRARQKEAVEFLDKNLFQTPHWLLDVDYMPDIVPNPNAKLYEMLNYTMNSIGGPLINGGIFMRLLEFANNNPGAYTADEYLSDLDKRIFTELDSRKTIDPYRRYLQKTYIDALYDLIYMPQQYSAGGNPVLTGSAMFTDLPSLVKDHLSALAGRINAALPFIKDKISQSHLRDTRERLLIILNRRK